MLRSPRNRLHPLAVHPRAGLFMVFGALLMVLIFAFVAFSVDVGYMNLVKSELQNAADAAAMAGCHDISAGSTAVRTTAKAVAAQNMAGGSPVILADADIELGFFNDSTKTFEVNEITPNAVRVTARVINEQLFFATIMNRDTFNTQVTSTAMLNPRDIVFVVDLSGSMNDDTEPCWGTAAIEQKFSPEGYSGLGVALMQDVYDDFGYGTFPGSVQHIGLPLGVPQDDTALACMTQDDGPLADPALSVHYRIEVTDDEYDRRRKAYRWIIDYQIAPLMPNALPTPDSTTQYSYWRKYIDYVLQGSYVGGPVPPPSGGGSGGGGQVIGPPLGLLESIPSNLNPHPLPVARGQVAAASPWAALHLLGASATNYIDIGVPRQGSSSYIWVPVVQDSDRLGGFNNPNTTTYPDIDAYHAYNNYRNKIGYLTYVQFMMDWGRDRSPGVDNSTNSSPTAGVKTPLSKLSPHCPTVTETIAGRTYHFPPREQPMHAVRRSLISAIDVVRERNYLGAIPNGDRVAIVTFDGQDDYHSPQIVQSLTSNYTAGMDACVNLQAVADVGMTTATEAGLQLARDHLKPVSQGGQGRIAAKPVIVLLTDGVPNVISSSSGDINDYISDNPSADYYPSAYTWLNAPLTQAARASAEDSTLFPVGMGLGTDYDFMDRMARFSGTDNDGESIRGSGNPAQYEARLTEIFTEIIHRPGSRLVK